MCHDLTKQLSYYFFFFLLFYFILFYLGLITQEGVQESVVSQVSHSCGHMISVGK